MNKIVMTAEIPIMARVVRIWVEGNVWGNKLNKFFYYRFADVIIG